MYICCIIDLCISHACTCNTKLIASSFAEMLGESIDNHLTPTTDSAEKQVLPVDQEQNGCMCSTSSVSTSALHGTVDKQPATLASHGVQPLVRPRLTSNLPLQPQVVSILHSLVHPSPVNIQPQVLKLNLGHHYLNCLSIQANPDKKKYRKETCLCANQC